MVFNKYQGTATKPLSREIVYTLLQKKCCKSLRYCRKVSTFALCFVKAA